MKVGLSAAAEHKAVKKEWKLTGGFDLSANDVGGAKVAMAVSTSC